MRCGEPRYRVPVAIHASPGPVRWRSRTCPPCLSHHATGRFLHGSLSSSVRCSRPVDWLVYGFKGCFTSEDSEGGHVRRGALGVHMADDVHDYGRSDRHRRYLCESTDCGLVFAPQAGRLHLLRRFRSGCIRDLRASCYLQSRQDTQLMRVRPLLRCDGSGTTVCHR
jgi:hypothetical protein